MRSARTRIVPREIDNPRFNEFIADQVVRSMPSILVLLPPRSSNETQDLFKWRVVGCRWVLCDGLKTMMGISLDPAEIAPFELRELRQQDAAWYQPRGFSLETLLEHSQQEILNWLYRLCSRSLAENRYPAFTVFRWIYEEISGQHCEYTVASRSEKAKALSLIMRSIGLEKKYFNRHHSLNDEIRHSQPIIFCSRGKELRFVRLSKEKLGVPPRSHGKIELSDITGLFSDSNPFSEYTDAVVSAFKHQAGEFLKPDLPFVDPAKDRAFQQRLEESGELSGSGPYKSFSIELFPLLHNKFRFRLKLSLGSRPFLMQVCRDCSTCDVQKNQIGCPRSTYILWDVNRYPIHVVCEFISTTEGNVIFDAWDCLGLNAECTHNSILRHPFVSNRGKMSALNVYTGSICMERTVFRILSENSHNGDGDSPVFILLQLMKGAARILRYGLRKRDEKVPLHNNFGKLRNPASIYQAVIIGADNAEAEAARLNAEKIDYFR